MSERPGPGFVRDVMVGVGLVVLVAGVWVSVAWVSEWLDETIQRAVREGLRDAPAVVSAPVEGGTAEDVQEAVDEAVEDATRFFAEIFGGSATDFGGSARDMGGPMSAEVADRVIRFNIAVMTRRYRMDTIVSAQRLEEVDIGSQRRLRLFRARLGASVRATFGGSLDEQAFQDGLSLSTRTTVEDAAGALESAFDEAWSVD